MLNNQHNNNTRFDSWLTESLKQYSAGYDFADKVMKKIDIMKSQEIADRIKLQNMLRRIQFQKRIALAAIIFLVFGSVIACIFTDILKSIYIVLSNCLVNTFEAGFNPQDQNWIQICIVAACLVFAAKQILTLNFSD